MGNFIENLAARSLRTGSGVRPRLPSRFEPMPVGGVVIASGLSEGTDEEPSEAFVEQSAAGSARGSLNRRDESVFAHASANASGESGPPEPSSTVSVGGVRVSPHDASGLAEPAAASSTEDSPRATLPVAGEQPPAVADSSPSRTVYTPKPSPGTGAQQRPDPQQVQSADTPAVGESARGVLSQERTDAPPAQGRKGRADRTDDAGRASFLDASEEGGVNPPPGRYVVRPAGVRPAGEIWGDATASGSGPEEERGDRPPTPAPDVLAGGETETVGGETPTVRVHIGRIDVRAVTPPPAPPARAAQPRRAPALSLDEYLKQRSGERR